ncbi:hypothetical protein PC114_g11881 [Phytophthora cactorum]|nr:hypothetical protein PC114_g11881 [Phytophthora cactorum]
MRTNFTDAQDKRIVVLALEYESQRKRVEWNEVARTVQGKYSAQSLENRLRVFKRTYGSDLSRFAPCFFSTSTLVPPHKQRLRLLGAKLKEPSARFSAVFQPRTSANKLNVDKRDNGEQ